MKGLTFALAVKNEASTIQETLNSLLIQQQNIENEIIVCLNGTTDETLEKINEKYESQVKIIYSEEVKPNAWNALFNTANYDNIVFMDGDVIASNGSIDSLINVMENYNKTGAASKKIKVVDSNNPLEVYYNSPSIYIPDSILGCLYSIKRDKFYKRMIEKGYSEMPADIINDDQWVTLILENRDQNKIKDRDWSVAKDAYFLSHIPTFEDFYNWSIRIEKGLIQMEKNHSNLGWTHDSNDEDYNATIGQLTPEEQRIKNISRKVYQSSPYKILKNKAAIIANRDGFNEKTNKWDEIKSTKRSYANFEKN